MAYSKKLKQQNKKLRINDADNSLHRQIREVIMENEFLVKQEGWNASQVEIRATYDAFRIINLVEAHLTNTPKT